MQPKLFLRTNDRTPSNRLIAVGLKDCGGRGTAQISSTTIQLRRSDTLRLRDVGASKTYYRSRRHPRFVREQRGSGPSTRRDPSRYYFLRVPKGVAGVCHASCELARVVREAAALLTQPSVLVVAVFAKVFDPMAAGA